MRMLEKCLPKRTTWSRDETGATAVEYALLVALIAAVIIGIVIVLGSQVQNAYDTVIGRF